MPNSRYQTFMKNPVSLAALLSLAIFCPYLPFIDDTLLAARILSSTSFSIFIIGVAYLTKRNRLIAAILTLFAVNYILASYCEIGNFLVTGKSFKTEFWQLLDVDVIKLAMDAAPLLTSSSIILLILIASLLFQAILRVNRYNYRTKWSFYIIPSIMLVILAINAKHSSLSMMVSSYLDYSQMQLSANTNQYLKKIPSLMEIQATPGKNILHIILESFGDIYTDNNRFPNLTPNLTAYKNRGIWADDMLQTKNQANSYLGHLASACGRDYFIEPKSKEYDVSLGRVLQIAGYDNVFIRGARSDASGPFTSLYSKDNGYNIFISRENLEKKYNKASINGLGYSDDILFKEGIEQYRRLLKSNRPFSLTLFTLDMHGFPQNLSESCKSRESYDGPFSTDDIVQAAHCTDFLVGEFIDRLSQLPKYEDLVIVIHADHVQHALTPAVMEDSQSIYSVVFGAAIKPYKQIAATFLMDLPETILSLAEVKTNAKFYMGQDFSKPITRDKKVTLTPLETIYRDELTDKNFKMIKAPNVEQISSNKLHTYEDDNSRLSYLKLDGAIFSSLYLYTRSRQSPNPLYVLYPRTKDSKNDISSKNNGILLSHDPSTPDLYKVGIRMGVKSKWTSALLSDLSSGMRWEIPFNDGSITPLGQHQNNTKKQLVKKQVFHTNNPQSFLHLDQIKYIRENNFEALGSDPKMFINLTLSEDSPYLLVVEMDAPEDGLAKIYYKINGGPYSELNSSSAFITKGKNTVSFFLSKGEYEKRFRFDIGEKPGIYKFVSMNLYSFETAYEL